MSSAVITKDTGIGMTKEVQMRIFECFYKADPSRNRSNGGSGLGLSIVKKSLKCIKVIYRLKVYLKKVRK